MLDQIEFASSDYEAQRWLEELTDEQLERLKGQMFDVEVTRARY